MDAVDQAAYSTLPAVIQLRRLTVPSLYRPTIVVVLLIQYQAFTPYPARRVSTLDVRSRLFVFRSRRLVVSVVSGTTRKRSGGNVGQYRG